MKNRQYIKDNEVQGYSIFGGITGRLSYLWQAKIKDHGYRTIYENKSGERYVILKGKRKYFKKGHSVYENKNLNSKRIKW